MPVIYSFDTDIPVAALAKLFAQVDWTKNRSKHHIRQLIANTPVQITAWDGEQLVGYARVVADDIFRAFIEDVIVDGAYREQGVGSTMVRRLLERLAHVEHIELTCQENLIPYYTRFGFK